MPEEDRFWEDPEFHKLSAMDKLTVFRQLDPGFRRLTLEDQVSVIHQIERNNQLTTRAGSFVGEVLDEFGRSIADLPRRTVSSASFLGKALGGPFGAVSAAAQSTPQQRQDLKASALDVGTLAIPSGRILTALGKPAAAALGKLGQASARSAVVGLKAAPAFATPETAGDPVERAKELAIDIGVGGALPVIGRGLSPVGRRLQKGISIVTGGGTKKAAHLRRLKKVEQTVAETANRRLAQSLGLKDAIDDSASHVATMLDNFLVGLDDPAKIVASQLDVIPRRGTVEKQFRKGELGKILSKDFDPTVAVNRELIQKAQIESAALYGEVKALAGRIAEQGEAVLKPHVKELQAKIQALSDNYRALSSEAGRSLQQLQHNIIGLRNEFGSLIGLPDVPEALPVFRKYVKALREKGPSGVFRDPQFLNDSVGFMIKNIFPIFSHIRDSFTNTGALVSLANEGFVADIFDFVRKGDAEFVRSISFLEGMRHAASLRGKPMSAIEQFIDPTAMSVKTRIFFGERLDNFLFPGAVLKQKVDSFFKRAAAASALYEYGIRKANREGFQGVSKTTRAREIVFSSPDELLALAAKETGPRGGKEFGTRLLKQSLERAEEISRKAGWNRILSDWQERFAGSPYTKLFWNPFARWQFQFTRFVAEHSPMDPTFWRKVSANKATADDFLGFLTRNLQGIAGLRFVNEYLYDQIDFKTMEYVREDNSRIKLVGLTPLPDALMVIAALKGDYENAAHAAADSSVFLVGGEAEGLLTRFLGLGRYFGQGINVKTAKRELHGILGSLLPGRSLLNPLTQMLDPKLREGAIIKQIPLLSKLAKARINPVTGEEAVFRQRLPGTSSLVEHFPRGFPGSARETTPLEGELFRLGLNVRRPGRSPILTLLDEELGIGEQHQQRYEVLAGQMTGKFLEPLVRSRGYQRLPDEQKKEVLRRQAARIRRRAKLLVFREAGVGLPLRQALEALADIENRPQTR